jgi:membrane protein DedA with SNARE-associated domain
MGQALAEWVTNTMASMGYFGIGLLMFLENLFPPIPSELIMPLAGFTARKGDLDFGLVVVAGVVGTMVGALPWYYAGLLVGEPRLRTWADRYGKWLALSGKDIDKANSWFNKHGAKAVFIGRLVPGIRTVISLPAGINAMPIALFLLYSTIGTTLWIMLLAGLGYQLGENFTLVDQYLSPVSKIVALTLIVAFAVWVILRVRQRQSNRRQDRSD